MQSNNNNGAIPRTEPPSSLHNASGYGAAAVASSPRLSTTPSTVRHQVPSNQIIYNIHPDGRLSPIRARTLRFNPTPPPSSGLILGPRPSAPIIDNQAQNLFNLPAHNTSFYNAGTSQPPQNNNFNISGHNLTNPNLNINHDLNAQNFNNFNFPSHNTNGKLPNFNNQQSIPNNNVPNLVAPNQRTVHRDSLTQLLAIHNQLLLDTQRQVNNLSGPNFKPDMTQLCQNIPRADGDNPSIFIDFLIEVEKIVNLNIMPLSKLIKGLVTQTEGELQLWLSRLATPTNTWDHIKSQLLIKFLSPTQMSRIQLEKIFRYQNPNESLKQFTNDLEITAKVLNLPDETRIVTHILDSANSEYLPLLATIFPQPTTFEQLYQIAKRADENANRLKNAISRENPKHS